MSIEVLLDTPEISVIGPPATVELQLDIGSRGIRGSQIYSGFDDPNDEAPDASLLPNDLYIRESQGQTEGYIYQYLSDGIGGFQWEKIGTLKPTIFSDVVSLSASPSNLSASAGLYTYEVSIAEAFAEYPALSILPENLNIQISAELDGAPIVTSIKSKSISTISNTININFYALQYETGSWSASANSNANYHITMSLLA